MSVDRSLSQIVALLCRATGSPFSQQVLLDLSREDVGRLVSYDIRPAHYACPTSYFNDVCIAALIKKVPFPDSPFDRRKAAIENFWKGEHACAASNVRFDSILQNCFAEEDLVFIPFLERAREFCAKVLGPIPTELNLRFGPGATYGDKGRWTTIPDKITSNPTVTASASDLLPFVWETAWGRSMIRRRKSPQIVRGNRFTTVPKDAKKDRGICIEPSVNVSLQLAVGARLKSRLSAAGLHLQTLQPVHRDWARRASLDGEFATLDLSNASDTVATKLVKYLLPGCWYELLHCLRSPSTFIEGKWVRNEKFSSMGNGYTFELETLIFSSLCHSFGYDPGVGFSVFGDDIVFPSRHSDSLIGLLKYCGFQVNVQKTFTSGPFRESCGGDYFKGWDVRPYSLKDQPSSPEEWISLANGLRRNAEKAGFDRIQDSHFFLPWKRALDQIPNKIRQCKGPKSLGDLVIWSDEFPIDRHNGIAYVYGFKPVVRPLPWCHWDPEVQYAAILYGAGTSKGVIPRGSVSGFKIGRVALGF